MEAWRKTWRDGVEPLLSDAGLTSLKQALTSDDQRLIQGATTSPPPSMGKWTSIPVQAACALGYCGWQGDGLETVGGVEEFFTRMCYEIDQRLGNPADCRWFLNWFDETPRDEMRRELLSEVQSALSRRLGERFAEEVVV